jgi:hypothetical protein
MSLKLSDNQRFDHCILKQNEIELTSNLRIGLSKILTADFSKIFINCYLDV